MARRVSPTRSCYPKRLFVVLKILLLLLLVIFARSTSAEKLEVGKSLNVFLRYAYYGISMKVVPRNDSNKHWIFREPLVDIFKNVSTVESCIKEPKNHIHTEFNLELCENLEQLLQAYFREFEVEGMDEPWRAFTSSWNVHNIAKYFGIDPIYVSTPRSYILVRAIRRRRCKVLSSPLEDLEPELLPRVQALADKVTYGDKESVLRFIKAYGSHYIHSFSTGNSLYQVFVFQTPVFRRLKARLEPRGVNSFSKTELNTIFSPWYAEQVGAVLSASGNTTVTKWANRALLTNTHLFPYTNLMKMYGNVERFKQLDHLLQNEALVSLKLKSLSLIFKDPKIQLWFLEFLFNNMRLWEQNMYAYLGS